MTVIKGNRQIFSDNDLDYVGVINPILLSEQFFLHGTNFSQIALRVLMKLSI